MWQFYHPRSWAKLQDTSPLRKSTARGQLKRASEVYRHFIINGYFGTILFDFYFLKKR